MNHIYVWFLSCVPIVSSSMNKTMSRIPWQTYLEDSDGSWLNVWEIVRLGITQDVFPGSLFTWDIAVLKYVKKWLRRREGGKGSGMTSNIGFVMEIFYFYAPPEWIFLLEHYLISAMNPWTFGLLLPSWILTTALNVSRPLPEKGWNSLEEN